MGDLTSAGITGTVYTPPANAVRIAAGASIQAAVNANPAGTAFLLSAGTYSGQTISPKNGDSFYGENGAATLNGNGLARAFNGQGVSGVTLSGLKVTNYSPPANNIGALGTDGSSANWVIQGCEFFGIHTAEAIHLGAGMIIQDSFIHNNDVMGIGSWDVSGAIIRNNEISANNQSQQQPFTNTSSAAGIKIAQTSNTQILNNFIHDNLISPGIWTDVSCVGTVMDGNEVTRNGITGILDEIDYGATIRNNTIVGNNPTLFGGFRGGGIYIQNAQNADVYNNTITGNGGGIWLFENDRGSGTQGPWVIANDRIHDNTIQMSSGDNGFGGTIQTSDISFANDHYTVDGSARFVIAGQTASFAQWQAAGYDVGSGPPPPPPPPSPPPVDAATLVLVLSEDRFRGNAQFIAKVDGAQVGGPTSVTAIHNQGQTQSFSFTGPWSVGTHDVEVDFINDLHRGNAGDRNLWVEQVSLNGSNYLTTPHEMLVNGAFHVTVGNG